MTRCVAGLDTASNRFHLWCNNGMKARHICSKKMDHGDMRQELYIKARNAFIQILPAGTLLVIEEPIISRNGKTSRLLSMMAGNIEAATYGLDLFITWADIVSWKSQVVGMGNADKEYIKAWVESNLELSFNEPGDDDFYDAVCLAKYGEQRLLIYGD